MAARILPRTLAAACVTLIAASAYGQPVLVYDNIGAPTFSGTVMPRRALDDGSFTPGPGAGGGLLVTQCNVGFVVTGTGNATFDLEVTFYDTVNPAVTPVNSLPLGGFVLAIANIAPGGYQTGLVDLSGLPGGGIMLPDDNWGVEYRYLQPGSPTVLSTRATPLFAGNVAVGGPTVGASADVYWRDANNDGIYQGANAGAGNEARFFGGPPNLANFFLQLGAVVGPPPDCNGNGTPDDVDISSGSSQDCQPNGVPDECDVTGSTGEPPTSGDCNANGTPDECEPSDCNANGLPDDCDLVGGTASGDCNSDGVPDECQDCNTNGMADECDIQGGAPDCNTNNLPDDCDLFLRY